MFLAGVYEAKKASDEKCKPAKRRVNAVQGEI
jgi:hypothetical protein